MPDGVSRCYEGIDKTCDKYDAAEADDFHCGVLDEGREQCDTEDLNGEIEGSHPEEIPFAAFQLFEYHRGENAEAACYVWQKRDDTNVYDIDIVTDEKARVENTARQIADDQVHDGACHHDYSAARFVGLEVKYLKK